MFSLGCTCPEQHQSTAIGHEEYTDLRRTIVPTIRDTSAPEDRCTVAHLYEPPRFHMSVLPEPQESQHKPERRCKATELFLDLVYVLPLNNLTDMVSGENSANNHIVLRFVLYCTALSNAWLGEAFFNSRFNADDAIARFLTVCHVGAVVLMSYGIEHGSARHFGAGYLTVRLILIGQYFRALVANYASRILRRVCIGLISGFSISCVLWLVGCLLDDNSKGQLGLFYTGICIDICTPFILVALEWLPVSVHPTHMVERLTCFTIVVISVMLCEIVDPNLNVDGVFTEACLFHAAAIPFCLMTLYIQGVPESLPSFSASICQRLQVYLWIYMHIPLAGCLVYTTAALKNMSACDKQPQANHLTAPHAVVGIAMILLLLGVHHSLILGSVLPKSVSKVLTSVLLMLTLILNAKMTDQWYAIVIGLVVIGQLLVEYVIGMLHLQETMFTSLEVSSRRTASLIGAQRHGTFQEAGNNTSSPQMQFANTPRDSQLESARSRVEELEEVMYFTTQLHTAQVKQMQDRIHKLEEELENAYMPLGRA